jgi:uracil-DNA glycosylase family 4
MPRAKMRSSCAEGFDVATHAEILLELGLAPSWRLRASHRALDDSVASATTGSEPAVLPAVAIGSADDRIIRIANLDWSAFAADVDACTACGLCKTRKMSVPGVGDVSADWMMVGEAPGAEEDARGEPFVGQAGRLLDNMLLALGMNRAKNVYIANVLKCRPPQNRTPEPLEVAACRPYLDRQIALIKPRLIVALGKSAATTLLGVDASIASMRGRVHRYQGVSLIVTYHPAYLLRNLPDKAKAWEDLCLARATLRKQTAAEALNSDGAVRN